MRTIKNWFEIKHKFIFILFGIYELMFITFLKGLKCNNILKYFLNSLYLSLSLVKYKWAHKHCKCLVHEALRENGRQDVVEHGLFVGQQLIQAIGFYSLFLSLFSFLSPFKIKHPLPVFSLFILLLFDAVSNSSFTNIFI